MKLSFKKTSLKSLNQKSSEMAKNQTKNVAGGNARYTLNCLTGGPNDWCQEK
ncbi:hypothetical protein [Pseudoalteromonas luteoviolacea]|uniref:Uncharacterized protein n=1 Tax=Pseudoalteromonas luteoviolacea H33 TaxID=1365251 RepID=A0A162AJ58_9GAMM|nr:hypothetical protein [Pseudoalteromonas luteoviolacea]KZN50874.1 hypothetical protein N476_14630 [Pseudoalteromonas luteoviolacea H33]KZN74947.1 hypothetical protein N477_20265 [Pseudoalteromonas luteoviolacea H33-S]